LALKFAPCILFQSLNKKNRVKSIKKLKTFHTSYEEDVVLLMLFQEVLGKKLTNI
jgi:hypothetical protein